MKRKKKLNTSNLIILLSFLLMIVIAMYFILSGPLFNTNKIEIKGNKKVEKEEILKLLDIRKDKNIFMHDIGKVEKLILENPYIEDVNVKRKLPDKLQIQIKEKEIYAIIKDKEDYCYIDKNGDYVEKIDELDDKENNLIVEIDYIIKEDRKVQFKDEGTKEELLYMLESIRDNKLDKKINKINYKINGIIDMYTKDGMKIILGNNEDLDYNISRMSYIISDLQGEDKRKGTIDLTSGDYAIYKP